MEFNLPRGMRDLEPEDYSSLEKIRGTFIETCRLFGFKVMEPSPIELLATLEAKSGAGVRNEIYCFKDKSGREVGLRFDLTVGITRYVTSHRGLQNPVKVGSFSGMWRYDEPQYGRYRWFYQWDAEIIGPSNVETDAEIIEFTSVLFERLGLRGAQIRIGDRKLVEEFIKTKIGVANEESVLEMLRAVDKIGKKTIPSILDEYESKGIKKEHLMSIVELGKIEGDPDQVLRRLEEEGLKTKSTLDDLTCSLKARQVKNFFIDLSVVRGLDYYTGVVFETYIKDDAKLGALAGGGRFDVLPSIFGRPDMGATGVAGGVDRIILALSKLESAEEVKKDICVYVGYVNKSLARQASTIASALRRGGLPTELELLDRSLHRQLEIASASKIPFFVILAPREYSQGMVQLRDMLEGKEKTVPISDLATVLKTGMEAFWRSSNASW